MKLSKANLKKIAFIATVAGVGVYFFFSEMLGPLSIKEDAAQDTISKLEPQIKDATAQINRTRLVAAGDSNAQAAREVFAVMKSGIPDDPPVAWYQPRLAEFFKQQGIAKATCRWISDSPESDLPGYKSCSWAIDLPRIEFASLASALAQLENREGLLRITSMQIEASPAPDVVCQHAQLTVSTIVKEVKQ